ncbi:MAG: hypothetical protein Q9M28_01520 [Mariprofundaceae bacterium]|nr:hypothetical protein [Mariprofundaceae bacterium]
MHKKEEGFVLIASLTIIALMTMGNLAMYYRSVSNIQTNAALADRAQASYFAETAVNYMDWAMLPSNDADLDPYTSAGGDFGVLNSTPPAAAAPGAAAPPPNTVGRPQFNVSYFDNRALNLRKVNFTGKGSAASNMKLMWNDLPNMNPNAAAYCFLKLMITTDTVNGVQKIETTVTNVLPASGEDGALVWLTASPVGSSMDGVGALADVDMVVDPALLGGVNGGYDLVVYALGYINGKPRNLLRKKIRVVR